MDKFLQMPAKEREELCELARSSIGLAVASIEKDYWVCLALRELIRIDEWGAHLSFKGGTSLSKAWGLIDRLSEDIDIVVDRARLGFGGDSSPEKAPSKKKRKERVEALRTACDACIRDVLLPDLTKRLKPILPRDEKWSLSVSEDGESILFQYPTLATPTAYVPDVVKIELGARSDVEPNDDREARPYLSQHYPDLVGADGFVVRTVSPLRTFWEKALLLHEERHRQRPTKERLSRHFYDLWSLIKKGVAKEAVADEALFDRIVAHRAIYWPVTGVDYAALTPAGLRVQPTSEARAAWEADYRKMNVMIFGEMPEFAEVLRLVGEVFPA